MSNYLIELTLIHSALMLAYWLFLNGERQYSKMRFYLIASTLLAVAVPLLNLPTIFSSPSEPVDRMLMETFSINTMTPAYDNPDLNAKVFIWIYAGISLCLAFKLFVGVISLVRLLHKNTYQRHDHRCIVSARNIQGSFTFFNWIFVSDEIDNTHCDYEAILAHERAHSALGHTYDLILFELFKVFFWWLPTAWLVNRKIRELHEYQADAYALRSCSVERYSSALVRSTLKSNGLSLVSSFHNSLTLKRLTAMKQKARNLSTWRLAVLSALCTLVVVVFAGSEDNKNIRDKVVTREALSPSLTQQDESKSMAQQDAGNQSSQARGIVIKIDSEPENRRIGVGAVHVDGAWSGTIRGRDGKVVPGTNIILAEGTTGTVSNSDGTFRLKARSSQNLYVAFVNDLTVKLSVGNSFVR